MNGTKISLCQSFKTVSFLLPIHFPIVVLNFYVNFHKSFKENLDVLFILQSRLRQYCSRYASETRLLLRHHSVTIPDCSKEERGS